MTKKHITDGTECWCNPQKINFNLSLGDVIHEGVENGKEVSYTMGDILLGCRKVLLNASEFNERGRVDDVEECITHVFDELTDILVCAGFLRWISEEGGLNDQNKRHRTQAL